MKTITCPECSARFGVEEKIVIRQNKLLIGEGKDEELFLKALLQQLGLDDIQVLGIGGKDRFRAQLKALKHDTAWRHVSSVGIVRDADNNPGAALQSVCDALRAAELPVPTRVMNPAKKDGNPTIRIMIIPSISKDGALEDLCLNSVAHDPATICVEQYFQCLVERGVPGPKKGERSKARTRVFIASKEDPTLALGIAAQKGYWPLDSSVFDNVKRFIESI
jgi:hypothetical protein